MVLIALYTGIYLYQWCGIKAFANLRLSPQLEYLQITKDVIEGAVRYYKNDKRLFYNRQLIHKTSILAGLLTKIDCISLKSTVKLLYL